MKNKFTIVTPLVLLVITLGFYACKKDYNSTSPAGDQYKNLDAKTAKIAQWYDDEASNSKNKTFASQNHADWTKLYNAKQKDEVTLYALPLYQKDSVYRELNINQVKDENYGLIKEYILHPKIKETELKFYTVSGRLIESGLLTIDNLYIRKKVEKGNTIRLMGSEDNPVSGGTPSNPFTWGGSNPLGGVTITGTYTPTTFPAPPTFGGSDGHGGTNYGGGGGGGTGGGGGAGSPSSTVPNTNAEFMNKIDDTKLADCFKIALQNLKNIDRACIPNLVTVFAGTTPGYNWKMQDGNTPGSNGVTDPHYDSSSGTVTTTFNSANFKGGSDLAIAKTILHESVHAYLVAYFKVDPLAANITYSTLVDRWVTAKNQNLNDVHHDEMVVGLNGSVAGNLMTYGRNMGYNLPDQFYSDLAWGGLTETKAFQNLKITTQKRIKDVISSEQSGKDSDGNSSQPKGNTAGGC